MRIRTIKECVEMIRQEDPGNTTITENGLRVLVRQGEIPYRKAGKKTLLNYDIVRDYYLMGDQNVR